MTAFGPEAERLRLLEIIQGNLERIHADLPAPKPVAETELELPGLPGNFRPVADLEAAELGQQQLALKTFQGESLAVEPTPQLNQTSEPQARVEGRVPLSTFLSYSHGDRKAKEIFQQNLTVMTTKNLITQWHDGLIEPGTRWREEIEANLERMNVFVGLLTTAFLASEFIEKVEIKAARMRLAVQDRSFLFVLILVDDISLTKLDLTDYQILRPGGKAVSQHKSRKEGFNVAQKELEHRRDDHESGQAALARGRELRAINCRIQIEDVASVAIGGITSFSVQNSYMSSVRRLRWQQSKSRPTTHPSGAGRWRTRLCC